MHIRRQLRNAIVETLQGIDDVRLLNTHRLEAATDLVGNGHQVIMVFPIADKMERINSANQGPRPTFRSFVFGVALVVGDEDVDDGMLDELSVDVERLLFAEDSPVRSIATRDVQISEPTEVNIIDGANPAVVLPYVIELVVPMFEGAPDQGF